jgi:hypothetical protein
MANEIILGNDHFFTANLLLGGSPYVIDPTYVVKATLVKIDRKSALIATPITLTSTSPEADWSIGKVTGKFLRADTTGVTVQGDAYLEIRVASTEGTVPTADDHDLSWFFKVNLIKGNIGV